MQQYGTLVYFAVLIAIFYFLIIRPQMQRQREQAALIASLAVGDRVITTGGIHGSIRTIEDDHVSLEIAPGVVVQVAKAAVARKLEA
jgi:preprotein translocase subunit YajC